MQEQLYSVAKKVSLSKAYLKQQQLVVTTARMLEYLWATNKSCLQEQYVSAHASAYPRRERAAARIRTEATCRSS